MKYKIYVSMKNNLLMHFRNNNLFIKKLNYTIFKNNKVFNITLEYYKGFSICNINNCIELIIYDVNSNIALFEDFIDVTNNYLYQIPNILNGSLHYTNAIIEGADGVGKTTITINLAKKGIIIYDRDVENITKKMKPHILKQQRINYVEKFLKADFNRKLIILYLSDEKELINRITNRGNITDFDRNSLVFQQIYLETFYSLKNYPNIFLIDCSHKSINSVTYEVQELLKNFIF